MTIGTESLNINQHQYNHQTDNHASREFGRPELGKLEAPREDRTPTVRTDENPYENQGLDNIVWQSFVNASSGASEIAEESIRIALFESGGNSNLTAVSLLDWADKAKALRDNIIVPQSTATEISEFQKYAIADQIRNLAHDQIQMLDTFDYLVHQGTAPLGLDVSA
jgi:hypothetical protein